MALTGPEDTKTSELNVVVDPLGGHCSGWAEVVDKGYWMVLYGRSGLPCVAWGLVGAQQMSVCAWVKKNP